MKASKSSPRLIAVGMVCIPIFLLSEIVYPYLISNLRFYLESAFNLDIEIFRGFLASFLAILLSLIFLAITQRQSSAKSTKKYTKAICLALVLLTAVYLAIFLINSGFLSLADAIIPNNTTVTAIAAFYYSSAIINTLAFVLKIFLMLCVVKISLVVSGFAEKEYWKPTKQSIIQTTVILLIAGLIAVFNVLAIPSLGMQEYLPWISVFSSWHKMQGFAAALARYYIIVVSLFLSYKCYVSNNKA